MTEFLPVIVLLAAGEGRRFGSTKQLAALGGQPMVRHAAAVAVQTGLRVVAVLGAQADAVQAALKGMALECVRNPAWRNGMGGSIAAGIAHLGTFSPTPSAAVVCLADQPLLSLGLLRELLARHAGDPTRIVACDNGGTAGPPALFPADLFPALQRLTGARGAHSLLRREAARVDHLTFSADIDVDTPAQLALVQARLVRAAG